MDFLQAYTLMSSKGVTEAWIDMTYNHWSRKLFWGNTAEFGVNASSYYMNNLRSYNCTDCDYERGYSPVILRQDGSWEVVNGSYTTKAVVCMDFNEVVNDTTFMNFFVDGIPQVFRLKIVKSEQSEWTWDDAHKICTQKFGFSTLAPVASSYLQRKVSKNNIIFTCCSFIMA